MSSWSVISLHISLWQTEHPTNACSTASKVRPHFGHMCLISRSVFFGRIFGAFHTSLFAMAHYPFVVNLVPDIVAGLT
jgi:hypothetical protein